MCVRLQRLYTSEKVLLGQCEIISQRKMEPDVPPFHLASQSAYLVSNVNLLSGFPLPWEGDIFTLYVFITSVSDNVCGVAEVDDYQLSTSEIIIKQQRCLQRGRAWM